MAGPQKVERSKDVDPEVAGKGQRKNNEVHC